MPERIASFAEFWPIYLRAHSDPRCRALHYAASVTGIATLATLVLTGDLLLFCVGLAASYAFAWGGHLFVQKNLPLTFKYPLWSFLADYRMFFRWLGGGLKADLARAGA